MEESGILSKLTGELHLDEWWQDLLGQEVTSFETFDFDLAKERIPWSELMAAKEIKRKLGLALSYTELRDTWYVWDERIHRPCDGDGISLKFVKLYFAAVREALAKIEELVLAKAHQLNAIGGVSADEIKNVHNIYSKTFLNHRKYRDRLSSEGGIAALARAMRTECDVGRNFYDNDRDFFVVRNGVFDIKTFRETGKMPKLMAHDSTRPVTKYFDADYNPFAKSEYWEQYLDTAIPDDESRIYLRRIVGAAMMGENKLRCLPNLYGPPGSGKSVFINAIFKLAKEGAGYGVMPDSRAITKVQGQNFEQDSFRGRRFIGISEPSHSEPVDDDFLKKITGDEWVETRTLNVKSDGWVPQGVIFVASNKPLKINTRDKATVERVQMIEFPFTFVKTPVLENERPRIGNLEHALYNHQTERSAILTWIIRGMLDFAAQGFVLEPPKEVIKHRDNIVAEASSALRWLESAIEEELIVVKPFEDEVYFLPAYDMFAQYKMWCSQAEERTLSRRFFIEDIANKYGTVVTNGVKRFKGITATHKFHTQIGQNGVKGLPNDPDGKSKF